MSDDTDVRGPEPTSLERAVGRVESKVDILLDRTSDHNKRLRDLETARNWLGGALAIITICWGAFIKLAGGKA